MNLTTRLRYSMARLLLKAGGLSIVPPWVQASFIEPSFRSLVKEGYTKNAAFFGCVSALTFALPEPPLIPYTEEGEQGQPLMTHPLRGLLRRPNPRMGERELVEYTAAYLAIGGNAYWHKVRDKRGRVIELWPYHAGQIAPIPGGDLWITGYAYDHGSGQPTPIPADDIVHFKWPAPDPTQPWQALPPLVAAAREVDADNEATRYLFALLKNDAVPRTVISMPQDAVLSPDEWKRMKAQFTERYGGDHRGEMAIIENGAKLERMALNLQELAFDALHRLPEKRICAALRTPPVIAGLGDDPTYANSEQAYVRWTRSTLVPLWTIIGDEVNADLMPEFGGDAYVRHDLSRVAALQEDATARWNRLNTTFINGGISLQELRAGLGFRAEPEPDQLFATSLSRELLPYRDILNPPIDVTPTPAVLPAPQPDQPPGDPQTDPESDDAAPPKRLGLLPETKAARKQAATKVGRALQRVRRDVAKRLEPAVDGYFTELADRVVARAEKAWQPVIAQKAALPTVDDLIALEDRDDLRLIVKRYYAEIVEASWDTWNTALGTDLAFDIDDPTLVEVLKSAGERIRQIDDTTRSAIQDLLTYAGEQGWSIDQLVRGDGDRPGLRSVITDTYKGRARTIARTELGNAQNRATGLRYTAAGIAKVLVLDNGQSDPDDTCSQLNGTVQTIAWANANPLGHPNCTRCFAPYFEDES